MGKKETWPDEEKTGTFRPSPYLSRRRTSRKPGAPANGKREGENTERKTRKHISRQDWSRGRKRSLRRGELEVKQGQKIMLFESDDGGKKDEKDKYFPCRFRNEKFSPSQGEKTRRKRKCSLKPRRAGDPRKKKKCNLDPPKWFM